jgi:hypothetical protein
MIRPTKEAEYPLAFTFIKALNEGTPFDRPAPPPKQGTRKVTPS